MKTKKVILGVLAILIVVSISIFFYFGTGIGFSNTKTRYFSRLETVVVRGSAEKLSREYKFHFLSVSASYSSGEVIGVVRRCKSSFFGTCDSSKEGFYPIKEGAGPTRFDNPQKK